MKTSVGRMASWHRMADWVMCTPLTDPELSNTASLLRCKLETANAIK